jgi:hypothetical protein
MNAINVISKCSGATIDCLIVAEFLVSSTMMQIITWHYNFRSTCPVC